MGTYDSCENGEALYLVCEMCEHQRIRYVQVMAHDDYPKELACGRKCAEKMEEDYAAAKRRDYKLKRAAARKKDDERRALEKQIARGWKESGGSWRACCEGGKATVFPNNGGYQIRWARSGQAAVFGDDIYSTAEAAKRAAARGMAKWALEERKKDWQ